MLLCYPFLFEVDTVPSPVSREFHDNFDAPTEAEVARTQPRTSHGVSNGCGTDPCITVSGGWALNTCVRPMMMLARQYLEAG